MGEKIPFKLIKCEHYLYSLACLRLSFSLTYTFYILNTQIKSPNKSNEGDLNKVVKKSKLNYLQSILHSGQTAIVYTCDRPPMFFKFISSGNATECLILPTVYALWILADLMLIFTMDPAVSPRLAGWWCWCFLVIKWLNLFSEKRQSILIYIELFFYGRLSNKVRTIQYMAIVRVNQLWLWFQEEADFFELLRLYLFDEIV